MNIGKTLTVLLWVVLGLNYLFYGNNILNYLALALLIIHAFECVIFYKKISLSEDHIFYGVIQTLIFGVLYIKDLSKKA